MDVVRVRHAFYNKAAYNLSEAYFHDIEAVTGKFTSEDPTVLVDNAMKAVEAELADTFPPKALDLAFKIPQLKGGRWSGKHWVGRSCMTRFKYSAPSRSYEDFCSHDRCTP